MPGNLRCPQCGARLAAHPPRRTCPECGVELARKGRSPRRAGGEASRSRHRFVPPRPEALAKYFPQLEISKLLGRGGMGAVYRARQLTLDRPVAVKILPEESAEDSAFAARFTREARALARLNHPNIVSLYDFGHTQGLYYFVMEYVDGVSLRQMLQRGRPPPRDALAIVLQICEALDYAHGKGVVHRDVKPANILVDKRGEAKIADFGLAKILGQASVDIGLTQPHDVMGTLHYMAPEQLESPLEVDERADIYSVGVVFYELLTGELPMGVFAPPSKKVPVDPALDRVVLRALAKDARQRFQQIGDLRIALESTAAGARRGRVRRARQSRSTARRRVRRVRRRRRSSPQGPVPAVVILGVILGILLIAGYAYLRKKTADEDADRDLAGGAPAAEGALPAAGGQPAAPAVSPRTPAPRPDAERESDRADRSLPPSLLEAARVKRSGEFGTPRARPIARKEDERRPDPPGVNLAREREADRKTPASGSRPEPTESDEGLRGKAKESAGRSETGPASAEAGEDAQFTWQLPQGGYGHHADALAKFARQKFTDGGLTVEVSVIPDAFAYEMARGTREIAKAGHRGKRLETKLRELYKERRSAQGKVFFIVSLSGRGAGMHYFLTPKLTSHFELRAPAKKTLRVVRVEPRLAVENWQVFEYPPDRPRRHKGRLPLVRFRDTTITLSIRSPRKESTEPMTFAVGGIVRQRWSEDGRSSIRTDLRQISCTEWRQLMVPSSSLQFYPGTWKVPSRPPGLASLLKRLEEGR